MKSNRCEKRLDFEEEYCVETGIITGELNIDVIDEEPMDLSRIRKMLCNRMARPILEHDLTRNEAVAYLLYEDGYSNSDVVRIMSALFDRTFLKQNVNDYRRKAQVKMDRHSAF